MICTAGAIDSHIHFICPQLVTTAITSGVTTLLGGGTGPAHGTLATTCTPGAWNLARMLEAAEAYPVNLGFFGKGNSALPEPLREQVAAGACGLKLHEDWGTTPAAIDCCLGVADETDVQVAIHTDTLNEAGFVEDTIRAFRGRTIHTFHAEGAGGGHAPDILRGVRRGQRAAQFHQPHPAIHRQHGGGAPRHADGVPPPRSLDPRGRGVRGQPHPAADHRRRGHPARPGRDQHYGQRQPGDGTRRRGDHPHLADRAQDEAAARRARRGPCRSRQRTHQALRRQVHHLSRRGARGSAP